jgi:hypothetical protein
MRFGRSTVVYGGSANGYVNRGGINEHSEPLSSRVGDYWGSCGHPRMERPHVWPSLVRSVRRVGDGAFGRQRQRLSARWTAW